MVTTYPQQCPLCDAKRYIDEDEGEVEGEFLYYQCGSGWMLGEQADPLDNHFVESSGCALVRHWQGNHAELRRRYRHLGQMFNDLHNVHTNKDAVYDAALALGKWSEESDPMQVEWGHLWTKFQQTVAEALRER